MSALPDATFAATSRNALDALDALAARYRAVRARSLHLAAPLSPEDAMVQSMDDASPAKWHLAHTTWFFERFVLGARAGYRPVDPQWDYLFNSYYQSVGPMHARPQRGLISRPSLDAVRAYRSEIDARIARRFDAGDLDVDDLRVVVLGTHHEQQHQELLLTDIKHALWCNPLKPAYRGDLPVPGGVATPLRWRAFDEAIVEIGATPWPEVDGRATDAFAFDSESPRHRVLVGAHALASRPASNAEYRAFIDDGGYRDPNLWMSEGWARVQEECWSRPMYWDADGEREFTLAGLRAVQPDAPVCHLSYFEADAFARWAGARLPTEFEWEQAAATQPVEGNFADDDLLHPHAASVPDAGKQDGGLQQLFGDVWEWTSSAYTSYPGFRPLPGALGEYNGKFMCGQWILRGGSCATPRDHMRASYRNFFAPPARWQFSGVRLAKDTA
ncbi:MAG: ergothioneine biosynthesis protein EgtB [Luteimonas sp.]